jgi:hypothetical protein
MNLKVLKWLLAHRDALVQIVEIAKGYNKTLPFIKQWEIVDRIARIVIPVLEAESVSPRALSDDGFYILSNIDDDNREVELLAAGATVVALGIDWKIVVETVLPIILAILKALLKDDEEE